MIGRHVMSMQKRSRWSRYVSGFVFLSLLLSIVYTIIQWANAPVTPPGPEYEKLKSDYALMVVQCFLGILAMLLPGLLARKWRVEIPSGMMILYLLFLYAAIYLGEVQSFYYRIPHWDMILHGFSGGMLGALAFSFVRLLNKFDRVHLYLSPLFTAIFAFCFSITLGVFWEFYEYSADYMLGLNMQKFLMEDGTALIGRKALSDTMQDLITDAIGAVFTSSIGYVSLKYKKGWVEKVMLKRQPAQEQREISAGG